ncbi:exosome complex component RRP45 [Anabrus simplex]|uniref:exosome complex component RRP45 n=1 Tax=Anabrus simplex TaxID=316456 RepID=UPI0035A344AD
MKEGILSNCEKAFILKAISENKRLDGRQHDEFRKLQIHFGSDWGCCQITLGQTKVLAQVSCEVQQPKPTRPNEGLLLLYVELSPMGAPHFEVGQSDLGVQLNRLLEKCIKDSRCLDLESLCITAEEKVWAVRVDINVLNHEGNLVDAASIAALTALAHFRRPDVTTTGDQTIIHDPSERDPIPLSLHHHPVCITYAIFNKGENVIADPSAIEERVSEAQIVFGVNAYRELCGLHLGGSALATPQLVLKCAVRASKRALEVVQTIKHALEQDNEARLAGKDVGFMDCIRSGKLLSLSHERFSVQLDSRGLKEAAKNLVHRRRKFDDDLETEERELKMEMDDNGIEPVVVHLGNGSAELIDNDQKMPKSETKKEHSYSDVSTGNSGSEAQYKDENSSEEALSDTSEVQLITEVSLEEKKKVLDNIDLSGDSEEEETSMLQAEELNQYPRKVLRNVKMEEDGEEEDEEDSSEEETTSHARGWYSNSWNF